MSINLPQVNQYLLNQIITAIDRNDLEKKDQIRRQEMIEIILEMSFASITRHVQAEMIQLLTFIIIIAPVRAGDHLETIQDIFFHIIHFPIALQTQQPKQQIVHIETK